MTSPGLKRPLDLEIGHNAPKSEQIVGDATVANSNGELRLQPKEVNNDLGSPEVDDSPDRYARTAPNGHKRLCTTTIYPLVPSSDDIKNDNNQIPMSQESTTTSLSPSSPSISPTMRAEIQFTQHQQQQRTHSPINEDIDSLIREELHKASEEESQRHQQGMQNGISEPPILTARQTQKICEKMIKIREQRLRDEYDRKLASKLAEQYDLFAKAKYLNTFSEPAQSPATSPVPSTAAATAAAAAVAAAAASSNSSITNAIAAAFMQRSAVSATANPIMSSTTNSVNPVNTTCTAQNLPNLSNLAASLNANGHNNAMAQPHLTASYIRQNAAVALRQAQLQQQLPLQHPMQLQHPIQSHQLQHRNSICSNSSTLPLGPVLLTSNLDEQLAIPEALFTLFGVFGDVVRVKILFNKKDNALVQMADANQAQVAQGYLDKQKIFGKVIRVTRSKHQLVQMPREGNQTDAGLTKDFTNSPLHRFKIPGSRNYLNIYPPSNTLHISNIPAKVDEKDLHKAFKGQCGFEFYSFKFFLKDRKMALMKFNSIEHATIALIKMHNFQISEDNNLRVSFSKSSI